MHGRLRHEEGQAQIVPDREAGTATVERSCLSSRPHRMLRELRQHIDLESGVIVQEAYWLDGELHRLPSEGPAYVTRHVREGTVTVTRQEYYLLGKRHREQGPAQIIRDRETGTITVEGYWLNGRRHRNSVDGPALVIRDAVTRIAVHERYLEDGKFHRDPSYGAAVIERDGETGAVRREEYWHHGEKIASPERGADRLSRPRIDGGPTL